MKHIGVAFDEIVIAAGSARAPAERLDSYGPSGRVPVLHDGELRVWDSLAICEYLAEHSGKGWPQERAARAVARAVCAEMHSGFTTLRSLWPMNARARNRRTAVTTALEADVERIDQLWNDCRNRFGAGGPWLFGEYYDRRCHVCASGTALQHLRCAHLARPPAGTWRACSRTRALQEWLQAAQAGTLDHRGRRSRLSPP